LIFFTEVQRGIGSNGAWGNTFKKKQNRKRKKEPVGPGDAPRTGFGHRLISLVVPEKVHSVKMDKGQ
jgi:hypothetical protein